MARVSVEFDDAERPKRGRSRKNTDEIKCLRMAAVLFRGSLALADCSQRE